MQSDNDTVEVPSILPVGSSVTAKSKVIPMGAPDKDHVTPLVHRAGRAPTRAVMVRWFKAMKEAGIPQGWVHYPDGTKLEFRSTVLEAEADTWADVA
jgi:hypothetical protein